MGKRVRKKYYLICIDEEYKKPIVSKRHDLIFLKQKVRTLNNGIWTTEETDLYPGYALLGVNGNIGSIRGGKFVSKNPLDYSQVLSMMKECEIEKTIIRCEFNVGEEVHVKDSVRSLYAGMVGIFLGVETEDDGLNALLLVDYNDSTVISIPLDYVVKYE